MATTTSSFRSRIRTATDRAVSGLAILATVLVIVPLVAIFVYLLIQGCELAEPGFLHAEPRAGGRVRRRHGKRDRRVGCAAGNCERDRSADRHRCRNLSCGVWTRHEAGECNSLYRGCAERRSIDCDGPGRVFADRGSAGTFFSLRRRCRAGNHDDSHGGADHRKRCC